MSHFLHQENLVDERVWLELIGEGRTILHTYV